MSLATPPKVEKLQKALHAKAKGEPGFRFYQLYDKLYREDILAHAWALCRSKRKKKRGAAGVDGETFADIESRGVEDWLGELGQELREKRYRAAPLKRVWLPKSGGGRRPLGIPTIRDRVAQTAAVLVLSPIFEADLEPEQYAYRAGRDAHEAVRRVHGLVRTGHEEVIEADVSGYFDAIPHAELMRSVARRVSDRQLLALIKQWLVVAVEEDDGRGGRRRTNRARRERRGIPQGAPISPLLSNLYMRRLVLGWKRLGHERRYAARIVNYADDFVICCRGDAAAAMEALGKLVRRLGLELNESKSGIRRLPAESVEFLGYTIGRCHSSRTGRAFIGTRPSRRSVRRVTQAVNDRAARCHTHEEAAVLVGRLNDLLAGWGNYFCLGPVSTAYRAVDAHARERLRQWLCAKHRRRDRGRLFYPDEHLYDTLGLVCLSRRTRDFPWAKA